MEDGFATSLNAPQLGRPSLARFAHTSQGLAFRGWPGLLAMALPRSLLLATQEEHPFLPAETRYQNHTGQSQEAGSGDQQVALRIGVPSPWRRDEARVSGAQRSVE